MDTETKSIKRWTNCKEGYINRFKREAAYWSVDSIEIYDAQNNKRRKHGRISCNRRKGSFQLSAFALYTREAANFRLFVKTRSHSVIASTKEVNAFLTSPPLLEISKLRDKLLLP